LVLRAHKVFKETREKSVQQVLRGQLALQAPQEQQGLSELRVLLVQRA